METDSEPKISEADKKLIYYLSEDSRIPNTILAKRMRLNRDTLNYRINKLKENGTIQKFVPKIDFSFFNYNTYHVFYVTNDSIKERRALFLKKLVNHPNTKSVIEYTDRWEIGWELIAKDIRDFDDISTEISTEFTDVILEKAKLELVRGYKSSILPEKNLKDSEFEFDYSKKEYIPDDKDTQIISAIKDDCRKSSYVISEETKISPNNVRYRLKNLEKLKTIKRYTILPDLSHLGMHEYTVCIVLKYLDKKNEAKLRQFMKVQPNITKAEKTIGNWDIILKINAVSLRSFHKTMMELQDNFSGLILNYEALITYKHHCYNFFPDVLVKNNK